jgi:hypothetical protein
MEISFDVAVRRMRFNRRGLSRAIKLGVLPGVKPNAKTIPEKVVRAFCEKYIMLAEVGEHIDGGYPELKDTMERMGRVPARRLSAQGGGGISRGRRRRHDFAGAGAVRLRTRRHRCAKVAG